MLKRIAAYCLIVLGLTTVIIGFITFLFFRHYSGKLIPYPWAFILLGIGMLPAGYLLMGYAVSVTNKADLRKLQQRIEDLKANGEKIPVDLNSCDIRGHDYSEQVSSDDPDYPFHYLHHYHINEEPITREIPQSIIIFPYSNSRTGLTEKFYSPVIPKDQLTLSFYLDRQKQTTLYVDRTNRKLYYFDLDFLKA
ncbi:hypothetical protein [Puia dinghuensis]|uniref:Uncharacterized protein n=1 Tax=Puia dinghuensis TaxID=1792502 RepID=A0A8J2UB65_9BACT|nr:hypothetical protein [Puia dinghuensis]GGA91179.1 hypothetical protein GCM10011511_13120 [Puia dinghuensis]